MPICYDQLTIAWLHNGKQIEHWYNNNKHQAIYQVDILKVIFLIALANARTCFNFKLQILSNCDFYENKYISVSFGVKKNYNFQHVYAFQDSHEQYEQKTVNKNIGIFPFSHADKRPSNLASMSDANINNCK